MLQYLAIAMPTKKCEEHLISPESVDLQKNVRRIRFSCLKKPGIPIFLQKYRTTKKSSRKFLFIAT